MPQFMVEPQSKVPVSLMVSANCIHWIPGTANYTSTPLIKQMKRATSSRSFTPQKILTDKVPSYCFEEWRSFVMPVF
jgi:hypothetical protein